MRPPDTSLLEGHVPGSVPPSRGRHASPPASQAAPARQQAVGSQKGSGLCARKPNANRKAGKCRVRRRTEWRTRQECDRCRPGPSSLCSAEAELPRSRLAPRTESFRQRAAGCRSPVSHTTQQKPRCRVRCSPRQNRRSICGSIALRRDLCSPSPAHQLAALITDLCERNLPAPSGRHRKPR